MFNWLLRLWLPRRCASRVAAAIAIHARGDLRLTIPIRLAVEESRGARARRDVVLARLMEVLFIEALRSPGPRCPSGILRGLGDERVAEAIRVIDARPTAAGRAGPRQGRGDVALRLPRAFWRMVLAKRLLENGKLPVAEVACKVGCSTSSTFSVAFSHHNGITPTLYARQAGASSSDRLA